MCMGVELDALARAVLARAWIWTPDQVADAMTVLGFGEQKPIPDMFEFQGRNHEVAIARLGDEGEDLDRIASVSVVLAEGDACDDELARALSTLVAALGPAQMSGGPSEGDEWVAWADYVHVWKRETVWLTIQDRQDDTDLPRTIVLTWCAPNAFTLHIESAPAIPVAPPPSDALTASTPLRITLRNGRTLEGLPLEIVHAMREQDRSKAVVKDYVAMVKASAYEMGGIELAISGNTDEEIATSLLFELLRTGGARKS